jgi:uncharacterized protein YyaL (SSP411 family)
MSMSAEERQLHQEYETANPVVRQAVYESWNAVRAVALAAGMSVAGDDRAEQLVAAIYRFVRDSAE